jgi:hypothetical protein
MRTYRTILVAATFLFVSGHPPLVGRTQLSSPAGQPARDTTAAGGIATIRGRVVAAETGEPLARAEVTLPLPPPARPLLVYTDAQGRYAFNGIPAGRYTIEASKTGYVRLAWGQRHPDEPGRPVAAVNGETVTVDFALAKGGVLVARVIDALGEPRPGVVVKVFRYQLIDGEPFLRRWRLGRTTPLSGQEAATDESGMMRLAGLVPGDYYVSAEAQFNGNSLGPATEGQRYVPTFYPGALSIEGAQLVAMRGGEETSITIPLVAARLARISGVIRDSSGLPVRQARFLQYYAADGHLNGPLRVEGDGTFVVTGLMPGRYVISVFPTPGDDSFLEFANFEIIVRGEDLTNLVVTTARGGTMRGRFVFDDEAAAPQPPGGLQLEAARHRLRQFETGEMPSRFSSNDEWAFEVSGLFGAVPFKLRQPSHGWFVKALLVDGKDMADSAIDFRNDREVNDVQMVLTRKQCKLSGGVVDARNAVVADAVVVIFPENRELWTPFSRLIATARPDQTGQFKIEGLPPGRYLATAVGSLESGAERVPAVLERLRDRAVALTLAEGEVGTLTFKVVD